MNVAHFVLIKTHLNILFPLMHLCSDYKNLYIPVPLPFQMTPVTLTYFFLSVLLFAEAAGSN